MRNCTPYTATSYKESTPLSVVKDVAQSLWGSVLVLFLAVDVVVVAGDLC